MRALPWLLVPGLLAASCTSAEPPAPPDRQETVEPLTDDRRADEPRTGPLPVPEHAWVWFEGENAERCIAGCPLASTSAAAEPVDSDAPPLRASLEAGRLAVAPVGATWRAVAELRGATTGRLIQCTDAVFVVLGEPRRSSYDLWVIDAASGQTRGRLEQDLGVHTLTAMPQLGCRPGGGLLVHQRLDAAGRALLGVDAFDARGGFQGSGWLDGGLAALDAPPDDLEVGPKITNGRRSYRFDRTRRGRERPWVLHGSGDGREWTTEFDDPDRQIGLKPTYSHPRSKAGPDARVFEHAEHTIVMWERSLFAFDLDDGEPAWRAEVGGLDLVRDQRHGSTGLGLRGCSGCVEPFPDARVEGDVIVFAIASSLEHYVNVVQPATGKILARRIFE